MEKLGQKHNLLPYEYYYDGMIRRSLHEFGERGLDFYNLVLEKMIYRTGDVAIDVGAGMGFDGKEIAWTYRPKIVFLLEPAAQSAPDLDERYAQIFHELDQEPLSGVELLQTDQLQTTLAELKDPNSAILKPSVTYIQPIAGRAEELPADLENQVTKLSMIHTIYEFDDVERALQEAVRVMRPDASGVVVTNGPEDKLVFKELLQQIKLELDKQAPEENYYSSPNTVSSRIDYLEAEQLLKQYFKNVVLMPYKDTMVITESRLPSYQWSLSSYRRKFDPPIINSGRWQEVCNKVMYDRVVQEMDQNGGVFRDTIDIGAIFFSGPRK